MRMNRSLKAIMTVCLFLSFGAVASAKEAATVKAPQAEFLAATYSVPDLSSDLAKDLVKSLSKIEGLVAAKPDMETSSLVVTFETELITQAELKEAMAEIAPEATLEKLAPAPHKHTAEGCGKCPKRHTCSKQKDN